MVNEKNYGFTPVPLLGIHRIIFNDITSRWGMRPTKKATKATGKKTVLPLTDSGTELKSESPEMLHEHRSTYFHSEFLKKFYPLNVIGQGSFGCVFEAENVMDKWKYAVKRIPIRENDTEKALKEAQLLAKLDHPGIVRYKHTWIERPPERWQVDADMKMITKFGTSRNQFLMNYAMDSTFFYIQMELCKYSLTEWLDANRDPSMRPLPRMELWFKQMLSAVAYIHDMNIIHRDLKPGNILFYNVDHLKVCDLGLATPRREEEGLNSLLSRSNFGTELYRSPENNEFWSKYSSKTDVYAFGLILTELCVVLSSDERTKIFSAYRRGKQSNLIVDAETAEVVEALTQVDPERRPTCKEMLEHPYFS